MKTYVQPWICKVKGETETTLQLQSTEKVQADGLESE